MTRSGRWVLRAVALGLLTVGMAAVEANGDAPPPADPGSTPGTGAPEPSARAVSHPGDGGSWPIGSRGTAARASTLLRWS